MKAIDRLKIDEGFRSKPYHCPAGKLTIGYGRNIEDNGITQEEAEFLLRNDFERSRYELRITFPFTTTLSNTRFDILAMMIFNMGLSRFRGFKKMLHAVELGDTQKVSDEMLNSQWAKQVGKRANRLAEAYVKDNLGDDRE
jgi:lysozyme